MAGTGLAPFLALRQPVAYVCSAFYTEIIHFGILTLCGAGRQQLHRYGSQCHQFTNQFHIFTSVFLP